MEKGLLRVSGLAIASILAVGLLCAADTATYSYDALGRLISTTVSGGPANGSQVSTNYDPADNRTAHTVSATTGNPPTFSINSASATEGTALVFTILKSGNASGALSINYATANGTATSSADYTNTSGTATFTAAETSKTISIPTVDDTLVEGNETFMITLSNPSAGATITTPTGTGTIIDNDAAPPPPPSFAIGNASPAVEGGTLVFTVTKTGSTSTSYSVAYASAGGTATSGSDFTATSGTLTFLAADTSKTVSVATVDDAVVEGNETVLMNLSSPSGGATITTAQGSGTISDNDTGNQPPVANPDNAGSIPKCGSTSINVITNDTDPDGNLPLTLISVSSGAALTVSVVNSTTVSIESNGLSGTKTFTYVVSDSLGATATGTVTVNVTTVNNCP